MAGKRWRQCGDLGQQMSEHVTGVAGAAGCSLAVAAEVSIMLGCSAYRWIRHAQTRASKCAIQNEMLSRVLFLSQSTLTLGSVQQEGEESGRTSRLYL